MGPEASTGGGPVRARLIERLGIVGLRHVAEIDILGADPAPVAAPAEETDGILLAKCLKPGRIINYRFICYCSY